MYIHSTGDRYGVKEILIDLSSILYTFMSIHSPTL